jgi:hypothetical protein
MTDRPLITNVAPAILSIIGWHAGESPEDIVERKCSDVPCTIWVYQSWKARVEAVQQFGNIDSNPVIYFLEGRASPARTTQEARQMSGDRSSWKPLPEGIGKVTANLPGSGLLIGKLSQLDSEIDLWEYLEHPSLQPLRFQRGASTACVVPAQNGSVEGMINHIRRVVAVGRLVEPYAVFLRQSQSATLSGARNSERIVRLPLLTPSKPRHHA